MKSKALLEKYIQGTCTPEEESQVHEWFDQNEAGEEEPAFTERWYRNKEQKIWKLLQSNLPGLDKRSGYQLRVPVYTLYRYAGIAALLCLVLWVTNRYSGGMLWWEGERYTTAYGEIKEVSLKDGSVVTLNAMSELKVPKDYGIDDRKLYLSGEAYFKVKHDAGRAFLVYSDCITTKALGTEFNVSSYPEDKRTIVSLKKGKVEVKEITPSRRSELILNPGEEASIRKDHKLHKSSFSDQERLSWKAEYVLLFKDAGMEEVLGKLKRHYGVDFNTSGLKDKQWKLTGEYKAQSLNDVLESLAFNYNLRYQIREKEVLLLDDN